MAARPWVTPQEVRDYTEIEAVQNRSDERLTVDITRAEQYVIAYTNNSFEDYDEIPAAVKTAVIILAQAYAYNTVISASEVKSETFDDYSYTAESSSIDFDTLDLEALLSAFVIDKVRGNVIMRLRKF